MLCGHRCDCCVKSSKRSVTILPDAGFNGATCAVLTSIDMQSPDIAMGVNESLETKNGAADQDDLIGAGDKA